MIASVHLADVGGVRALSLVRRTPRPGSVPGLRQADVALAAPLSGSPLPTPALGRIGLVALWDDDVSIDRFLAAHPLAAHPLAAALAGGWHVRLEPLRASGSWPGLPPDVPETPPHDQVGPVAALTLARVRGSQVLRWLRASARAEAQVVEAPGLVWTTGLARPPFVATCSLWESTAALTAYAYGQRTSAHPAAVAAHQANPFHHESAVIRFRPYGSTGSLAGRNPLAADWPHPAGAQ